VLQPPGALVAALETNIKEPLSKFAFKFNLRHDAKVIEVHADPRASTRAHSAAVSPAGAYTRSLFSST